MPIKITTVNNYPVVDNTVSVPYTTTIEVSGTGLPNPRDNRPGPFATVALSQASPSFRKVHGKNANPGDWQAASFTLLDRPGADHSYTLTATNDSDANDCDWVTVTVLAKTAVDKATRSDSGAPTGRRGLLQFNAPPPANPLGNPLFVMATGTVLDGRNAVTCTLTPIDNTGQSTGPSLTTPAQMNGNSWTASFFPTPNNPGLPANPANPFQGLYLFEASAPNEGIISAGVDIPPV
jgi:hypothetical protein